jgi:capsular exopolysaccharide synthesis family protein
MMEEQSPYVKSEGEYATDLIEIFKDYLRYWPWFLLSMLICITASRLYLRYTPNVYQTSAKIKIIEEGNGLNLDMEGVLFNKANVNLENEIQILTSYKMLEKVVVELKLRNVFKMVGDIRTVQLDTLPFGYKQITGVDIIPETGSFNITVTPSAFEVYNVETDSTIRIENHDSNLIQHSLPFQIKIESPKQLAASQGNEFNVNIQSTKQAVLALRTGLSVEPVGDYSDILELKVSGESIKRSEKVLNAIISAFNQDGMEDRQLISRRTLEFIDERFIFLSEELDSIELGKKEFKQDNNLVYIEADSQMSLQKRAQSDEEVFRIENQLALAQLLDEAINNPNTKSKLLPANFGLASSAINTLIEKYNTAILDCEKLISSGGINNPVIQQLQVQLRDLRDNINNSLGAFKNELELSQRQLSTRDKEFKSEVYSLPLKEKLLRAINRQQTIKESLFLLLLQKREEASISLAVTEPAIKVVEYALSNTWPISPKPRIAYLGALIIGLGVPFGILFVIFLLDNKIHSKTDIEKINPNIPVIGEIPKIQKGVKTLFSDPNDRSILAESFRIFSSNVNYLLPSKGNDAGSVICVTSTIKGEGKTFISLNLSLAFSSLNKKVLLIGADLRNPQLHSYLDIDKNQGGLSNYLHDLDNDWKESLVEKFEEHQKHKILISGVIPPNPPNLLTNGRFEELLDEAKIIYDYIIIDTAPTIAVTDTLLISKFADATIYVARANYTEKALLSHSNDLAKYKKLKNMAYVINQVGESKGYKYGYKYGYNYGYGYGYGEEEARRSIMDKIFNR